MCSKEAKEKDLEHPCCWAFSFKWSFIHKCSKVLLWDWMQVKTHKKKQKKNNNNNQPAISAVLKPVFTFKNLARHPSKYLFNILNDSALILYRSLEQIFKPDKCLLERRECPCWSFAQRKDEREQSQSAARKSSTEHKGKNSPQGSSSTEADCQMRLGTLYALRFTKFR